uniref:Uncharacterized protein n=1 Tax=Ditylenchus dipsaci TaxID=166011 RepID=A0A915DPH2_9BILA
MDVQTSPTGLHPAGLLMISPGVGIQLEDYMERILPGSVAKLKAGQVLDHPAADRTRIRVDLECLQEFVNNCVTRRQEAVNISCPVVRIVHGLYDKLVPYGNSLKLLHLLKSANKGLFLINDGHFIKDQHAIGYALDSLWNSLLIKEQTIQQQKQERLMNS